MFPLTGTEQEHDRTKTERIVQSSTLV